MSVGTDVIYVLKLQTALAEKDLHLNAANLYVQVLEAKVEEKDRQLETLQEMHAADRIAQTQDKEELLRRIAERDPEHRALIVMLAEKDREIQLLNADLDDAARRQQADATDWLTVTAENERLRQALTTLQVKITGTSGWSYREQTRLLDFIAEALKD